MNRIIFSFIGLFCALNSLLGQQEFNVTLLYDQQQKSNPIFQKAIKTEIESLLSGKYELVFTDQYLENNNVCFALTCNTLPNTGENDDEKMESLGLFYKDVFTTFPVVMKEIKNYPEVNLFENDK